MTIGRPQKIIDWSIVEKLLEAGCSGAQIAPHFNIIPDTLYTRALDHYGVPFSVIQGELCSKGDSHIKLTQYLKAIGESTAGDNTMLVWLGKQRLKQRENPTESMVPEEVVERFDEVMGQMTKIQEEIKKSIDKE